MAFENRLKDEEYRADKLVDEKVEVLTEDTQEADEEEDVEEYGLFCDCVMCIIKEILKKIFFLFDGFCIVALALWICGINIKTFPVVVILGLCLIAREVLDSIISAILARKDSEK